MRTEANLDWQWCQIHQTARVPFMKILSRKVCALCCLLSALSTVNKWDIVLAANLISTCNSYWTMNIVTNNAWVDKNNAHAWHIRPILGGHWWQQLCISRMLCFRYFNKLKNGSLNPGYLVVSREQQIVEGGELLMRSLGLDSASTNRYFNISSSDFLLLIDKSNIKMKKDGGRLRVIPAGETYLLDSTLSFSADSFFQESGYV